MFLGFVLGGCKETVQKVDGKYREQHLPSKLVVSNPIIMNSNNNNNNNNSNNNFNDKITITIVITDVAISIIAIIVVTIIVKKILHHNYLRIWL